MERAYDRKTMKEELLKRTQESSERKEGEIFIKYFKRDLEIPLVKFGTTKEDPHILDIIPFKAGKMMPDFMRIKEGKDAYYLDVYVHQNVGPGKAWVVCPSRNYGQPCPVCDYIDGLVREGKEYEDYSDIAPKRRCVYNIVNQSTVRDARKGVQIWEVSHKFSEKPIQAAARTPRGGGSVPFSHPDKDVGMSVSFSVDSDTYKTISGHKLIPRDYDIGDDILDQAYQLDQIVEVLSYEEIEKFFNKAGKAGKAGMEVKDAEDEHEEQCSHERRSFAKDKEETANKCPAGGVFGEDIDKIAGCDTCLDSTYQRCAEMADMVEVEKRKARSERTGIRRSGREEEEEVPF